MLQDMFTQMGEMTSNLPKTCLLIVQAQKVENLKGKFILSMIFQGGMIYGYTNT